MRSAGVGLQDPAPPEADFGDGRGGWAWLVTARDFYEAELIRGVLEGAGVPVALDRRDPSPFAWMHLAGNPQAPIRVLVPASLLEAARLELMETTLASDEPGVEPGADEAAIGPHASRTRSFVRAAVTALTAVIVVWIVFIAVFGWAPCILHRLCF
jgi:hypothetical protein